MLILFSDAFKMSSLYSLVPPKEAHELTVPIIFVDFDVTTPFLRGGPWGEWTGTPFSERDNFIRYGLITGFRVWVGTHIQGYSIHCNWNVCGPCLGWNTHSISN